MLQQNPKHVNRYELCHNRDNQKGKIPDQSECNHLVIWQLKMSNILYMPHS